MSADSEKMIALMTQQNTLLTEIRDLLKHGTSTPAPTRNSVPYRQTPARPAGGAVFPNYGRAKGEPIRGAKMSDLEYYATGARKTLADPAKARWHANERVLLEEIEAEIARQGGAQREEPITPSDDPVPF